MQLKITGFFCQKFKNHRKCHTKIMKRKLTTNANPIKPSTMNVSFLHGKTVPPRIFFSPQAEVFPRAAFTPEGRLYARAKRGQ